MTDTLKRVLQLAAADLSSGVRRCILEALAPRLDPYLVKADVLRLLCIALHDNDSSNQHLALGLLGRLAPRNPAFVEPVLRRFLIELLTDLNMGLDPVTVAKSAGSRFSFCPSAVF